MIPNKRKKPGIKFVGLHAHSVSGSPFDALGYPQDHMDWAFKNGSDALALTDHGNCNGLSYQVLHAKKMEKQGKKFKPIYGVEAYFVPSIEKWFDEYTRIKEDRKQRKMIFADDSHGAVIEDEEETKREKNIINRRHHIVLLAMNQIGLNNLFKLVSISFRRENFYRYPRIDLKMLARYNEGLIASSACIGGIYGKDYWQNKDDGENAVLNAMRKTTENMMWVFGDRWYGELSWNSIPEQHIINRYIIQISKDFGFDLISTADSHYPKQTAWKDRDIYKRLGWLNKKATTEEWYKLPKSVNEIGYELYPKNGDQMWESYKKYCRSCGVSYDDDLIRESIERTYTIAHDRIETFYPDNTVRLPGFVVPKGETANSYLAKLCKEGLIKKNLLDSVYIKRCTHELKIIKGRGFSKYFLTMKAISDRANSVQLVGAGRGSGAGSLVSYVLGITSVDPLRWGLLFSRFLRSDATDYPDIDYDVSEPMQLKEMLIKEWGETTVVPISNWNTLQLRSLIKDIAKFYRVPYQEVNHVTNKMLWEATPQAKRDKGIQAGVYNPTFEEVMKYSKSLTNFLEKYPMIKTHVKALHGQVRSCFSDEVCVLTDKGEKRPTDIENGDGVAYFSSSGNVEFNYDWELYHQGKKEIFEVETENGEILELTGDHEVYTQRGYVRVDELLPSTDFLVSVE